jgi:hypothetical protein
MDQSIKPARPRSGRKLVAAFAISAILVVAVVAAFLLGAFDAPLGGGDGTNDGDNGLEGGSIDRLPFDLKNGDFIEYSMISSGGGLSGTMRMTFLNITDDSYDVEMVQTINDQTFTFTWKADGNDTVGSVYGDESDRLEDFGELIGEETTDTELGPRKVDHYRATDDGTVVDYFIGAESPILYRTVTTGDDDSVLTIELSDTNIEDIRNANR